MRKHPFIVFLVVMGGLIFAVISFMQSRTFADIAKAAGARYLPKDLGITADFAQFGVKLFPPAVSIINPRIGLQKGRLADLPVGSSLEAERIDLVFTPFQLLTGRIEVEEIAIQNGKVDLRMTQEFLDRLQAPKPKKKGWKPTWEDLLQIRARGVALSEVELKVWVENPSIDAIVSVKELSVYQKGGSGGLGYAVTANLQQLKGTFPKDWGLPAELGSLSAEAFVNAKGLKVSTVSYEFPGLRLNGRAEIEGDFLSAKATRKAWAEVDAKGRIDEVVRLVPRFGNALRKLPPAGEVEFQGRLESPDLAKLEGNLRAEGQLTAKAVRFQEWNVGLLEALGSWSSDSGELELKKVRLSSPVLERVPGVRVGSGGLVEAGPVRVNVNNLGEFSVPVHLENAHLHWLAAPVAEKIFSLDMRATLDLEAQISAPKGKPWKVEAKLKGFVSNLLLDNQKPKIKRKRSEVLAVKRVELEGGVSIDENFLRPQGLRVILPNSSFDAMGSVDLKKGVLDLRTSGEVDLKDIGQLMESEIRGHGLLRTHIHGPGSAIVTDFDFEIADAYYLNLALGSIKGRVSLEDGPELLQLRQLQGSRDRSRYVGDGMITLKEPAKIQLKVDILEGSRMEDVIAIFQDLTENVSWFPRKLKGDVQGVVDVAGELDLAKISIMSDLNGQNWDYWGERFKRITGRGGFVRGAYVLENARVFKNAGFLDGRIRFDEKTGLDWEMKSSGLSLSDFDRIAAMDVPLRGRLSITTQGKGKFGELDSKTQIGLTDLRIRGMPAAPSELTIRTSGGRADINGVAFDGQGILQLVYDFKAGGPSSVRAELRGLDFSPALLMLNPALIQDRNLLGVVSGAVDLKFISGKAERATGEISLTEYKLGKTGALFELVQPGRVVLKDGTFDRQELKIRGKNEEMVVSARGDSGRLSGLISGKLDLSLTEFFTSAIARASNPLELDLAISGLLKEPMLSGRVQVQEGFLRLASVETPLERIRGNLTLRDWKITVQNLNADVAQGRANLQGTVDLFMDRFPKLELQGSLMDARLKIFPFQYLKLRGKFDVTGDDVPYLVRGDLESDSGLSTEKVLGRQAGATLKTASYTPPPAATRVGDLPLFKLEIDVNSEGGLQFRNDLFIGEAKGRIRVLNTIEAPRLLGAGEVVTGKLVFNDREFAVQAASVEFDNPAVINPKFSLTGSTTVDNVKVNLFASGRLENFKIEFSSDPPMNDSEILQLLALGISASDVRRFRGDGANMKDVFSLMLYSFDFNRDLKEKTGIQLEFDEVVDTQTGQSAFRPQPVNQAQASPLIVIRRQIGSRFDVSVGTTVGVGANTQRQFNAEYHVTPKFSVIGVFDSLQGVQAQERTSWGLDLKYQDRFK
jgi:hypothetical protein